MRIPVGDLYSSPHLLLTSSPSTIVQSEINFLSEEQNSKKRAGTIPEKKENKKKPKNRDVSNNVLHTKKNQNFGAIL